MEIVHSLADLPKLIILIVPISFVYTIQVLNKDSLTASIIHQLDWYLANHNRSIQHDNDVQQCFPQFHCFSMNTT